MFDYEISKAIGIRVEVDIFAGVTTQVVPIEKTSRGFSLIKFSDHYGAPCSLQESSLAYPAAIWLGADDAQPKILASHLRAMGIKPNKPNGWVDYEIPPEVSLTTRMHLTQADVLKLLPYLQKFAETGELGGIGAVKICRRTSENSLKN